MDAAKPNRPRLIMNSARSKTLGILGSVVWLTVAIGCSPSTNIKPTFERPERMLALQVQNAADVVSLSYLIDTQDVLTFDVAGSPTPRQLIATSISSNASRWMIQLQVLPPIGDLSDSTRILDVRHPAPKHIWIPQVGKVTAWFLSDQEILKFYETFGAPGN